MPILEAHAVACFLSTRKRQANGPPIIAATTYSQAAYNAPLAAPVDHAIGGDCNQSPS
jgi:hypothetical protein